MNRAVGVIDRMIGLCPRSPRLSWAPPSSVHYLPAPFASGQRDRRGGS